MDLVWITSARYLGEYRLELTFNNGEVRVFDGREIVNTHPLFRSLQSREAYRNYALDGWTISWENGKIDLAPEYLYEQSVAE